MKTHYFLNDLDPPDRNRSELTNDVRSKSNFKVGIFMILDSDTCMVIETGFGISSFYFYFRTAFVKLFFSIF